MIVGDMLAQNSIKKCNQLISYAFRLFNNEEKNYTATKKEALIMSHALHNFKHYLLGNKFIFFSITWFYCILLRSHKFLKGDSHMVTICFGI
jgi:hypothetical protein